jgi:ABC-type phosphate transport system permease subunit
MAYQSVFAAGLLLFLLTGMVNFLIRKSGYRTKELPSEKNI